MKLPLEQKAAGSDRSVKGGVATNHDDALGALVIVHLGCSVPKP